LSLLYFLLLIFYLIDDAGPQVHTRSGNKLRRLAIFVALLRLPSGARTCQLRRVAAMAQSVEGCGAPDAKVNGYFYLLVVLIGQQILRQSRGCRRCGPASTNAERNTRVDNALSNGRNPQLRHIHRHVGRYATSDIR
jgi:hypothetical protein